MNQRPAEATSRGAASEELLFIAPSLLRMFHVQFTPGVATLPGPAST